MSDPQQDRPFLDGSTLRDSKGWDGKSRVDKKAIHVNTDALSDPDFSDEDAPPVEQIDADEDLLDDYETDADDIDLVHCRISSIPALKLESFTKLEKLCLRQNQISHIEIPNPPAATLLDLDLYDNLISHVKGLDHLLQLRILDLSFNKIKHIKNINHLEQLTDLFFVQNRIQRIEGLKGLTRIRNLELAANRIREIENLDTLASLEQLWLGKNKITELKNLNNLTSLKILSVQSNRLANIMGLARLVSLEELYVSHNAITSISGLDSNLRLRVIDISNNQISHLTNLSHLRLLEEVWASSNQLSSFDEVEKELRECEHLSTVYLEGNPLQLKQPALYRNKVRLAVPRIKQIDATFVHVS